MRRMRETTSRTCGSARGTSAPRRAGEPLPDRPRLLPRPRHRPGHRPDPRGARLPLRVGRGRDGPRRPVLGPGALRLREEVACSGVHGANRLASNSLLEGLVFSRRIAAAVARDLPPAQEPAADRRTRGLVPAVVASAVQDVMTQYAGVLRSDEGLREAARHLAGLAVTPEGAARDPVLAGHEPAHGGECARRGRAGGGDPGARTGTRTSPRPTTRPGPGTSTSGWSPAAGCAWTTCPRTEPPPGSPGGSRP